MGTDAIKSTSRILDDFWVFRGLAEPGRGIGCHRCPGRRGGRLNKLHADIKFLSPHDAAAMAGLIIIEDKVEGPWDWVVNLDFSPGLREVANDALNGDTSKSNNCGAF